MKHESNVTHTRTMRGQYESDEHAVLFFTGMTLEALTDFKLDTGKEWIISYCLKNGVCGTLGAEELWMEPLLLQWWNLEWRRMDHWVILPMLHKVVHAERESVYREMHRGVMDDHHPSNSMLELALFRCFKQSRKPKFKSRKPRCTVRQAGDTSTKTPAV